MKADNFLPFSAAAFSLIWQSDLPLDEFAPVTELERAPDICIQRVGSLAERIPLHQINRGTVYCDGFRFAWGSETTFDVFDGKRVDYCPGSDWRGSFPHALFGTVAGLLLASRSLVPFHACAVELSGKAILICGNSGAGKSTLAAGLILNGAMLLSDDLSVVSDGPDGLMILPGRPSLRLGPEVASAMVGCSVQSLADEKRGKMLVTPHDKIMREAIPLAAIFVIGAIEVPDHPIFRMSLLREQLFRPKWLRLISNQSRRLETIKKIAHQIPIFSLGHDDKRDINSFYGRSEMVTELVSSMERRAKS